MSDKQIMHIRFGETQADNAAFAHAWHAAQAGALSATADYVLTFESLDGFLSCLTKKRWALLKRLRRMGPTSVKKLAEALRRDYKNVHTDITRLAELDLVARTADGLVFVPWDEIDAQFALAA